MIEEIKNFVKSCHICQVIKPRFSKGQEYLISKYCTTIHGHMHTYYSPNQ